MARIVRFAEAEGCRHDAVGGKGANLAEMKATASAAPNTTGEPGRVSAGSLPGEPGRVGEGMVAFAVRLVSFCSSAKSSAVIGSRRFSVPTATVTGMPGRCLPEYSVKMKELWILSVL